MVFGLLLSACSEDDEDSAQKDRQDTTYIIYDTDIGSSTDDLFVLGIIYYFANQKEFELIGGIVCRMGEEYIKLADVWKIY